jgi:hypothetical protein
MAEGGVEGDAVGEGVGVVAQPRNAPTSNRASSEKPNDLEEQYCFMS